MFIVSFLAYRTINKSPKKEKIRKSTPNSYVSSLKSQVSLEPPRHPKVVEEGKLINDVVCRSVNVKYVFVIVDISHRDIKFEGVAGSEEEFLLGAKVKPVIAWQSRLVKLR